MGAKIVGVVPGSIAQECGIAPGDVLVSIGGAEIGDILDYRFLMADEYLDVEVENPSGERTVYEIEKDYSEDLGLLFENDLLDKAQSCRNKCIFCFIDQLPKGMRDTLYFKDDDARMSFLLGNYITMTNLSSAEIDRIVRMHLSPVNISVHTTDSELRCRMLHNKHAGELLGVMRRLAESGIEMNAQIVACPGINDGAALDQTLSDLAALYPQVASVSVVPVGVTKFREGLYPIKAYDAQGARRLIEQVETWQREFVRRFGSRLVYLADELYLLAGMEIPHADAYEGFPQIENGVGMLASFEEEFAQALKKQADEICAHSGIFKTVACGVLAEPFFRARAQQLAQRNPRIHLEVRAIQNDFFGRSVTVSGLVCGCDLIEQLRGQKLGSAVLITKNMLKSDEDVFLDDVTLEDARARLDVPIVPVADDGVLFLQKVLE